MADPKGFLTTPREDWPRRPVEERVRDWDEVYVPGALLPIISKQADRCMDCGVPFCHEACPLGNLIPEWNDLVSREDWRAASDRLHATNNFPEFTGRLCPGAVRGGVCAGHQPARGHHQERRGGHRRPGLGGRFHAAAAAGPAVRADGRGDRLRAHRAGRGTAADAGRAHGRRVRDRTTGSAG